MLDADLERFKEELDRTKAGLRLRLASAEGVIAQQQIKRLIQRGVSGARALQALESWRRCYITACNHAAEALDALWDEFAWPTDGARDRGFAWTPKAVKRR
jgi:hypothetical protein